MGKIKKVLLVGNENTGKSWLIKRLAEHYCDVAPYEDYTTYMVVDDENIELKLSEAPCQEHYDQIRTLSYEGTQVILMVFSIIDPDSLENVKQQWINEVKRFCPKVPIVLVGTKKDLRDDLETLEELAKIHREPVTLEEAMLVANEICAYSYEECSAKKNEGAWRALYIATRAALRRKKN